MIDREKLDQAILAWYVAQKPDLDLADLGDRIAALDEPGIRLDPIQARIAHGWFGHVALVERVSAEEEALAARLDEAGW